MSRLVIAVDGPAASGKGTIAHGLAQQYGLPCLDTGLLYRAVGVLAQASAGEVSEAAAVAAARTLDPTHLEDPELRTRAAGGPAPPARGGDWPARRRFSRRCGPPCSTSSASSPPRPAGRCWTGATSAP